MTPETEKSQVTGDDLFMVHFTTLSEPRVHIASNEGMITNMAMIRDFEVVSEKFYLRKNLNLYNVIRI